MQIPKGGQGPWVTSGLPSEKSLNYGGEVRDLTQARFEPTNFERSTFAREGKKDLGYVAPKCRNLQPLENGLKPPTLGLSPSTVKPEETREGRGLPAKCREQVRKWTQVNRPTTAQERERDHGYIAPLIDVAEVEESIRVATEAVDRFTTEGNGKRKETSASPQPKQCLTPAIGGLMPREGAPRSSWYRSVSEGQISDLSSIQKAWVRFKRQRR